MMDSPEPLLKINPDQIIHEEFGRLDQKYESVSLRFRALGELIFLEDDFRHEYFLGIASGFRKLNTDGKDTGNSPKRDERIGNISIIDDFYDREARIFREAVRKATEKGDKYRVDVGLEISKKIDQMPKDEEYFREMRQQGQSRPHPRAFLFGASMIRDFVLENASEHPAKPREIVK